jgi:ABC-type spermidine/putrescine transport system permease subunit I
MRKLAKLVVSTAAWGLIVSVGLFYVVPLIIWCISLARGSAGAHSPGVDVFALYWSLIGQTITLSVAAALAAVICGSATALVAVSGHGRTRELLTAAMTVPLLMGFIARNYAWVGLLSQFAGETRVLFLSSLSRALLYKQLGIVVVMGTVFVPFCYFMVLQELTGLSPVPLQAARTMGASDATIFWRIILPSIRGSQRNAFMLSVVLGVGYFITPQLIGGGNFQFVGNGVLVLLDRFGLTVDASLLGLLLFLTVMVPVGLTGLAIYLKKRQKKQEQLKVVRKQESLDTAAPAQAD